MEVVLVVEEARLQAFKSQLASDPSDCPDGSWWAGPKRRGHQEAKMEERKKDVRDQSCLNPSLEQHPRFGGQSTRNQ